MEGPGRYPLSGRAEGRDQPELPDRERMPVDGQGPGRGCRKAGTGALERGMETHPASCLRPGLSWYGAAVHWQAIEAAAAPEAAVKEGWHGLPRTDTRPVSSVMSMSARLPSGLAGRVSTPDDGYDSPAMGCGASTARPDSTSLVGARPGTAPAVRPRRSRRNPRRPADQAEPSACPATGDDREAILALAAGGLPPADEGSRYLRSIRKAHRATTLPASADHPAVRPAQPRS